MPQCAFTSKGETMRPPCCNFLLHDSKTRYNDIRRLPVHMGYGMAQL